MYISSKQKYDLDFDVRICHIEFYLLMFESGNYKTKEFLIVAKCYHFEMLEVEGTNESFSININFMSVAFRANFISVMFSQGNSLACQLIESMSIEGNTKRAKYNLQSLFCHNFK